MATAFNQLPKTARSIPAPFNVSIPDRQLEEFQTLLRLSKIGPKTYENSQSDEKFGITHDWLSHAKEMWQKWDWRQYEQRINSIPNFLMPIDTGHQSGVFKIHFAALFSQKKDAIPILLLHGWPGNFMEFYHIIQLLIKRYTPETLPYHIIVPSLPGYAFSSPPPVDCDFKVQDVAKIMNCLMTELGFGNGYVVQGGDIGSKVSRLMAATYDEVKAIHINFCIMPRPDMVSDDDSNELEKKGVERADEFKRLGSAYALLQATKPATIGLVLAANPISLLAWIAEKFLAWTDENPPLEEILASVTLYWLTDTYPTSIYPYRQFFTPGAVSGHEHPEWHINKPLGYSWFPKELVPIPRSWAATTGNLVYYNQHQAGGHFAAMEKPEHLLSDIEAFIKQTWVP